MEAKRLFDAPKSHASSIVDPKAGMARVVLEEDGVLIGALFVSREPVAVMRDYLTTLPGTVGTDALTGRPAVGVPNSGPILCSCFGIGINKIVEAIETNGLMSVQQVGEAISAGTNCGSCRPEIADLLRAVHTREAAE